MIITNIIGGLGNQMFQYACARALSIKLGLPLKVAVDMFHGYTLHQGLELSKVFALDLVFAQPADLRGMIGTARAHPGVRKVLARPSFACLRNRRFIAEPSSRYWPELSQHVDSGAYLHGYWQSEYYFSEYAADIRQEFSFRHVFAGKNAEVARMIQSGPAISVHVRRGDYVSNPKALSMHGTCTPEYYFSAIDTLLERVPRARLFAFSDDPQWVAEVLAPRYPGLVLVDHNHGEHSYHDMHLMSLCQHNIIANSSFSWWGAWLNAYLDKMVIAPKVWFANGTDASDLVPSDWERM